jgi:Ca2+-dependent lipid-binding protein
MATNTTKSAVEGEGEGYTHPIGAMRLHFKSARGLKNPETAGSMDPYVSVSVSGVPKARTGTRPSTSNPDWGETLFIPVHSKESILLIDVMNERDTSKNKSLGYYELSVTNYIKETQPGDYMIFDETDLMSAKLSTSHQQWTTILNFTISFYPTLPVFDLEEEIEADDSAQNKVPDIYQ